MTFIYAKPVYTIIVYTGNMSNCDEKLTYSFIEIKLEYFQCF